jgi:hypothetical protein
MRGIIATLLVLSVLAGIAGAAYADDYPSDFWQRQEHNLP